MDEHRRAGHANESPERPHGWLTRLWQGTLLVLRADRWARGLAQMRRGLGTVVASTRTLARQARATKLPYAVLSFPTLWRRTTWRRTVSPPVAPRARIIVNPFSGGAHGILGLREVRDAAEWLNAHGLPTELCETMRPGHAFELADQAVNAGMELVVAAGGDGTLNEIIQALAGHDTALGVLPLGTVNVWAREMGIPLNMAQARDVLVRGVRRRVDLGRAGSRYFLLMAGIGFDAEVARRVERGPLKRLGLKFLDYLATAGILSVTQQSTRIWMRCDGKRRSVSALMVLIGNTRLYGGALTFAKQAVADDGLLDVVVVSGGGLLYRLGVLVRALLRRASLGPRVRYSRCRTVRLESHTPLPVQVDGEVIGTLPMTFTVIPSALTVVVPAAAPSELFGAKPLTTRDGDGT